MSWISDFWDDIKSGVRGMKEDIDDIYEAVTDGFKETVLKDNTDYKTSRELRDEASRLILGAEAKLERFKKRLNARIRCVQERLDAYQEYVQEDMHAQLVRSVEFLTQSEVDYDEMAKVLSERYQHIKFGDMRTALKKEKSRISRTLSARAPRYSKPGNVPNPLPVFPAFIATPALTTLPVMMGPLAVVSLLVMKVNKDRRVAASKQYLQATRKFSARVSAGIAKAQLNMTMLQALENHLDERRQALDIFSGGLTLLFKKKKTKNTLTQAYLLSAAILTVSRKNVLDSKGNLLVFGTPLELELYDIQKQANKLR